MFYEVTCVTRQSGFQDLGRHEASNPDEAKKAALAYSSITEYGDRILLITALEVPSLKEKI